MNKLSKALWKNTLPTLWILSVLAIIYSGFQREFALQPQFSQPYPWVGVGITILLTGFECVLLHLIWRPDNFSWSIPRTLLAFIVFLVLFFLLFFAPVADMPSYVSAFAIFTIFLTFLSFVLFIITAGINIVQFFSKKITSKE